MSFKISAMPAYNEESSIAKVILGCRRYVDKVVVIDDGSVDSTAEIAEALGAYVVRHPKNMGYGAALRSCFGTARDLKADKMVIIDSDGQHDPSDIPKLLEPLDRGADMVIGSRFCNGDARNIPHYRKIGMKILDFATNFAGETKVSDSQSGFRAYGCKAIEKIDVNGDGMSAGSEILLQINEHNLKVEEVEIHCNYDVKDASTHNPLRHGAGVLVSIMNELEFRRPLLYFTFPGIAFSAVAIAMGLSFPQIFYYGGRLSFGLILLIVLLALIGILMAFTGLILHSMPRMISSFGRGRRMKSMTEGSLEGYRSRLISSDCLDDLGSS